MLAWGGACCCGEVRLGRFGRDSVCGSALRERALVVVFFSAAFGLLLDLIASDDRPRHGRVFSSYVFSPKFLDFETTTASSCVYPRDKKKNLVRTWKLSVCLTLLRLLSLLQRPSLFYIPSPEANLTCPHLVPKTPPFSLFRTVGWLTPAAAQSTWQMTDEMNASVQHTNDPVVRSSLGKAGMVIANALSSPRRVSQK